MSYIIDGHNLIPKMPGILLSDPDDEQKLIAVLQEFCRLTRKRVEIYFDQSATGQSRQKSYGLIAVYFIRSGMTADDAIGKRLHQMRRSARNWTVVSSDQRVQAYARAAHAGVMSAEEFVHFVRDTFDSRATASESVDQEISTEEVDEWLRLFSGDTRD